MSIVLLKIILITMLVSTFVIPVCAQRLTPERRSGLTQEIEKDLKGMPLAERLYEQAMILQMQNQSTEALQKLKEALGIAKKEVGLNNVFTLELMSRIAELYGDQNQDDESISYLKDIIKEGPADNYLVHGAIFKLADIYRKKGDFSQAELYFKQRLSILEKQLEPDHIRLKLEYEELARFYREFGKEDKAREFEERAKKIISKY